MSTTSEPPSPPSSEDLESADFGTASGFANYFRTLGEGSRYTRAQFLDFFSPLDPADFAGKRVVELGFGHGSFLLHWAGVGPAQLSGVELGDTVPQTCAKLANSGVPLRLERGDLTTADLGPHDLAFCIGVIHHLQRPEDGFCAVLRHTRPGGHFHCWVYAREGNALVIHVVDVIRKLGTRLPWWVTKWVSGLAVAIAAFGHAKLLRRVRPVLGEAALLRLPGSTYLLSIADRDFAFFHFLATDFLVARHTVYLDRATLEGWLDREEIDPDSVYLIHRNGNSWKFGGRTRATHLRSRKDPIAMAPRPVE